ncbi:uncharacterized protein [Nicotiana tomentosiformis]|uniref:uncharacterized protein n=1 Tax=Nicotiana tomentosiformis TaxID=4098 RepID=UPI00388C69C0
MEVSGVAFTTFQLSGAVYQWWQVNEEGRQADAAPPTWAQFAEIFLRELVPRTLRDAWRVEFEQLLQHEVRPGASKEEQKRLERFKRYSPPTFSGTATEDAQGFLEKCHRGGLSKNVKLRPLANSEDLPTESPAPRQAEEKKRKRAPSSLCSEKKKTRRRRVHKSKESTSARAPSSDSLYQLRDESKEEGETFDLMARLPSQFEGKGASELERGEADLPQREGKVKSLRAELEVARKEHADLVEQVKILKVSDDELDSVTNGRNPQVQQKIDRIDQLRAKMDVVKAEAEEWRGEMDCLASEKETARAQLTSVEVQLRAAKEKAEVRAQKIEDLQSQLSSVIFDRETLAKDLEMAKLVVMVVKANVDEMVAQYKADA